jgi:predicted ATP-grasp superfamily ATP-dependent carboligase
LRKQVEALLAAISYAGIVDLDYRLDKRNGEYKLLDFNPRIGAQFRLFEDDAGIDVARALYLDLTGHRLPGSRAVEGRTFIVEFHDLAAGLAYFRRGGLTLHEWRASLKGTKELAWLRRDDPLPFLLMCIRLLLRVAVRILRIRSTRNGNNPLPRYANGLGDWVNWRSPEAIRQKTLKQQGRTSN